MSPNNNRTYLPPKPPFFYCGWEREYIALDGHTVYLISSGDPGGMSGGWISHEIPDDLIRDFSVKAFQDWICRVFRTRIYEPVPDIKLINYLCVSVSRTDNGSENSDRFPGEWFFRDIRTISSSDAGSDSVTLVQSLIDENFYIRKSSDPDGHLSAAYHYVSDIKEYLSDDEIKALSNDFSDFNKYKEIKDRKAFVDKYFSVSERLYSKHSTRLTMNIEDFFIGPNNVHIPWENVRKITCSSSEMVNGSPDDEYSFYPNGSEKIGRAFICNSIGSKMYFERPLSENNAVFYKSLFCRDHLNSPDKMDDPAEFSVTYTDYSGSVQTVSCRHRFSSELLSHIMYNSLFWERKTFRYLIEDKYLLIYAIYKDSIRL